MADPLSAAGSIAGGIAGAIFSGGDQSQAQAAQLAALQALQGVNLPTAAELDWSLQNYQNAGQLTPQMEAAITAAPSEFGNIKDNPALIQAQMAALNSLQQQSTMGLSASDRQALQEINLQTNGQAQAQNASIMQNMAQRGMGGSGAELAARLSAGQNAANTANAQGLSLAGQAQRNALGALSQYGAMGTQIRGQNYTEAANAAKAQDMINMFNTQNQQGVANANTGLQNNAELYNLQNAQNLSNSNTGVANQQEEHNTGVNQQVYQDALQKATGVAGQEQGVANYYGQQAQNVNDMWAGFGNAAGSAASSMGGFGGGQGETPVDLSDPEDSDYYQQGGVAGSSPMNGPMPEGY